jgi:hypothetical protein
MIKKKIIMLAFFLLLLPEHAFCEGVNTYICVECSPSKKIMTVTTKSELGELGKPSVYYGPTMKDLGKDRHFMLGPIEKNVGICNLDKNLKVKLNAWVIEGNPNGQCGASPPTYLTLKINGKKVLETEVEALCGGITLKSLKLSPTGIILCTYEEPNYRTDWAPENPEPKWHCEQKKLPN